MSDKQLCSTCRKYPAEANLDWHRAQGLDPTGLCQVCADYYLDMMRDYKQFTKFVAEVTKP